MHKIGVAFDILEDGRVVPKGYKKVFGLLIFDVNMDFTRNARWVLDVHNTPSPESSTHARVVPRESVRIAINYAASNEVDVFEADIKSACLQDPTSEKNCIICGPDFSLENIGKAALVTRAVYGGKAAHRDFRNYLRSCMSYLDFKPCLADPDAWMRPAMKANVMEHCEYVLLYTDDALVISKEAETC